MNRFRSLPRRLQVVVGTVAAVTVCCCGLLGISLVIPSGDETPTVVVQGIDVGARAPEVGALDTNTPMPTATTSPPTATPLPDTPTTIPTEPPSPTAPPPSATAPPEPRACLPDSMITSPANGSTVEGVVSVQGTANIDQIQYYKIEYGPVGDESWTVAGELHYDPVVSGVLGQWDTSTLTAGPYRLRLVVVDSGGNYPEPCELHVVVAESPKAPPTVKPTQPPPTAAPTTAAVAKVIIAGVANSGTREHVEIVNQGGAAQDLSGWAVYGSKGDDRYTFPGGYVLGPGARVRLHSGDNGINAPPGDIYWSDRPVWNNDGETVYLVDARGNLVHQYRY